MAVTYRERAYLAHNDVLPQFRWSAIIAGLIAAVATQFLLTAIGTALGVSAGAAAENEDAAKGLGIGAGIWMILSPLASMFVGGLVAAWMARPADRRIAGFHGAMVWCLSMAIGALMVGMVATGAFATVAGTAGATAASVVGQDKTEREQLKSEIKQKKNEAQAKTNAKGKTDGEKAADTAADVGTGAAWAAVLAMLLSLGSAILGSLTAHRAVYAEDTVAARDDSRIVKDVDDDSIRPDLH